jgi:choline/glycine/proline betaine transport protein
MDPGVFIPAAAFIILFVLLGTLYSSTTYDIFSNIQDLITTYLGWGYIALTLTLLIVCLFFAFSRWGRFKIGAENDKPEHSRIAWLSMLFSAGMGTGLVFWSVAEPLTHFSNPPPELPISLSDRDRALVYTFFHWGFHPWAIYSIFALGISYFHFRKGLPLAPRSLLSPLLGENIHGFLGKSFDVICTVGTLFGVATSLGLGAMQINSGLSAFSDLGQSVQIQIGIIAGITLVATISVLSGIHKGIKVLSQANIALAFLLCFAVFFLGPTLGIIKLLFESIGSLFVSLPYLSTRMGEGSVLEWQKDWTLFYWGWWISWSPFVGIFVARISKGRTVRELIVSVLLIPTFATFFWLATFGGSSFFLNEKFEDFPLQLIQETPAKALHSMVDYLPLGEILGPLATVLIIIFFITSSDSGSLVDDMVTSGGHPDPPRVQRVFWAVSEGLVAMTLLLAGGLKALQMASITFGLPMAILITVATFGLLREMRRALREKKH